MDTLEIIKKVIFGKGVRFLNDCNFQFRFRYTSELVKDTNFDILDYQKEKILKKLSEEYLKNKFEIEDLPDNYKYLKLDVFVVKREELTELVESVIKIMPEYRIKQIRESNENFLKEE